MKSLEPHLSRARHQWSVFSAGAFLVLGFFLTLWPISVASWESGQGPGLRIEAERWEDAEKIFRNDLHWLGGDGASSVDLGSARVLWLFGDSFVNPGTSKSRSEASIVRNSIAIQSGYDLTLAGMKFYWKGPPPTPASFFREEGNTWFWPGSGIAIKDRLLIFLMRVRPAKNELGFEPCGWKAVLVSNPGKEPPSWGIKYLKGPQTKGDIIVGTGSALLIGDFLYVFSTNWRDNKVYLVRWHSRPASTGDLSKPQWWAGRTTGWIEQASGGPRPQPVFSGGQTEFTVTYEACIKRFLQIQTLSFLDPSLSVRTAPGLVGSWSKPASFYSPPERSIPKTLIYAGKAHPVIKGADLVLTYAVNSTEEERLLNDMDIYFPIVLKARIMYDHAR